VLVNIFFIDQRYIPLVWWLGGLVARRLPRDRKVADSILTSGGGFKKKSNSLSFLATGLWLVRFDVESSWITAKTGDPVCKLCTLKNPWQLKIN
jgi:hypothetical protein